MAAPYSFTVGGVVGRSRGILERHGARLAAAAALMVALPSLLTASGGAVQLETYDAADAALGGSVQVASSGGGATLVFLTQILLNGFVIATAFAEMRGERPDARAALVAALRAWLPMLGIALLGALGIGLGVALLVVPGVMLLCAWIVVAPAYVAERPGLLAAFGRSRHLTAGHRWRISGLIALYGLAMALAFGLGAGLVLSSLETPGSGPGTLAALASAILSAAVSLGGAVGTTAIYIELRHVEDGPAPA